MSKFVFSELTNKLLNKLGFEMLKVEFNDEEIANVKYTKDGLTVNNFFVAYRYMKLGCLNDKIISEVF